MRFGKKLALQVTGDESGAPYISHKPMKEAINKTVRELRTYQSKGQARDQMQQLQYGVALEDGDQAAAQEVTAEELKDLEDRISNLDEQLFDLVDKDLESILQHIRGTEVSLEAQVGEIQKSAIRCSLIVEEQKLEELEKLLPFGPEQRSTLCQRLLELQLQCRPTDMSQALEAILAEYKVLAENMNQHIQYLEINVAGFRKLLKRHEKQIPRQFHARDTPFLGFHKLVTCTSRQLLEVVRQLGLLLLDARGKLVGALSQDPARCAAEPIAALLEKWQSAETFKAELGELKPLGPECQMVLEIQKQLKAKSQIGPLAADFNSSMPGILYPKPTTPAVPSGKNPLQDGSSDSEGGGESWPAAVSATTGPNPQQSQSQSARQPRRQGQQQQQNHRYARPKAQQQQPQQQRQQPARSQVPSYADHKQMPPMAACYGPGGFAGEAMRYGFIQPF